MTREQAKKWLNEITAFANGKEIQYDCGNGEWIRPESHGEHNVSFDNPYGLYRIKPEKKLRPWTKDEVPAVCIVRNKNFPKSSPNYAIHIVDFHGVCIAQEGYSFELLLHNWEWSSDRKNWQPCGVLE